MATNPTDPDSANRLTSQGLAELIVDSLVWAKLIKDADFACAVAIATERIDTRKALGDY